MNKQQLISIFIVDDNIEAVKVLQHMLERNFSVNIVGTASDAETAAQLIIQTEPDIIFLDVELPTMSGLDFCTLIRNDIKPDTKIVFYTGHDKYMLDAIRRKAFDYLLKPPTEQDLSLIMARYYENKLTDIPGNVSSKDHLPIILVVNALNEHLTLQLSDIAFFRFNQERKLWEITCTNNEVYTLRHRTTNQIKMIQDSICILYEPMEQIRELKISKNFRQSFMNTFYSM